MQTVLCSARRLRQMREARVVAFAARLNIPPRQVQATVSRLTWQIWVEELGLAPDDLAVE